VEVENISGVGLTSGRATEQERHLTVGNSLLGQIIVDDESVAAVVTEPFTDGTTSEGSQELEGSGLRGSGGNDDGVLHGIVLLKGLDELSDGRTLLTDGNVDTVELLGLIRAGVPALLVEDGIKSDGSLSSLTITDDKLTLATSDRDHGVNGLETGLDGLADGLAGENTRSLDLSAAALLGVERALSVNGVTETIDNTAEELDTDGNVDNFTGTLDGLTLLDETIGTEQHSTDLAGLQVQAHALDARGELDQLFGLDIVKTVDTGDTVTNGQNATSLGETSLLSDTADPLLEDRRNLGRGSLGLTSVVADLVNEGDSGTGRSDPASRDGSDGAGRLAKCRSEHVVGCGYGETGKERRGE